MATIVRPRFDPRRLAPDNSTTMAGSTQRRSASELFADPRPVDGLLFDPVEAERLQAHVFERVFGQPDPTRIGRYTVLERIGRGGMGVVYAAFDNRLDRKVAVKLVRRHHPRAQTRMLREAKAMARVSHPNVVQIHDVGEWQGQVFIAMELVVGITLGDWVTRTRRSAAEILAVLLAAGEGLAAAHAAGVVHRDFKPDNVLVGDDGRVRVLDFGIAQQEALREESPTHPDGADLELTETGMLVGTPAYMAPEQFRRDDVDGRADQFSFGVVLYEALCGARPFAGRDIDALSAAVCGGERQPLPRGAELPTEVRKVLDRALLPEPGQRFESMAALLGALQPPRRVSRSLVVLLVALIGASLGFAWLYSQAVADRDDVRDLRAAQAEVNAKLDAAQQDVEVLRQARAQFGSDPTMALATLRRLSPEGWSTEARGLATQAAVLGVARTIIESGDGRATTGHAGVVLSRSGEDYARVDLESGERIPVGRDSKEPLITPNGHAIAWCCRGQQLDLVLTEDNTRHSFALTDDVSFYVIAPSGDALAIVGERGARVHALPGGELLREIPLPDRDPLGGAALAPGGEAVAGLDSSGHLAWWDADGIRSGAAVFGNVRFSADGRWLSARTADRDLLIWPATADGVTQAPRRRVEDVTRYAWSPDGRLVGTLSDEHGIGVHDMAGGSYEMPRSTTEAATELAFSGDGSLLGGLSDGELQLWDTRSSVTTVLRWPHPIVAWAGRGDGKFVTVDSRGTVAHWEVPWRRLQLASPFPPNTEGVVVAYSEGTLIIGSSDGTVRRWGEAHSPDVVWMTLSGPVEALDAHGTTVLVEAGEALTRIADGRRSDFPGREARWRVQLDAASDSAAFAKGYHVERIDFATGEIEAVDSGRPARDLAKVEEQIEYRALVTRVFANDWWWRHSSASTLRAAALGGLRNWPMPRRPHLVSGETNGVLSVRTLDREIVERASGFAPRAAIYRVMPSGGVLARLEDDAVALWIPGETTPIRIAGSLHAIQHADVTLSSDQREVAIARVTGEVVRIPVPAFWWGDEPHAVIDEYTDVVPNEGTR